MNRIEQLRTYIDDILLQMEDVVERRCAYIHLYGVAQSCALIAKKRKLNAELATMSGMLHDFYLYKYMDNFNHAHKGAVLAKEVLKELSITTEEETDQICAAIYNHSDKAIINSDFDELLKDADVMQHCLYNPTIEIMAHETERFERLRKEFGLI